VKLLTPMYVVDGISKPKVPFEQAGLHVLGGRPTFHAQPQVTPVMAGVSWSKKATVLLVPCLQARWIELTADGAVGRGPNIGLKW
jgi:hypothetical protein